MAGRDFIVTFAQFMVFYMALVGVGVLGIANVIPVTPGALGTVDAALIALLVAFGLDESVALAATPRMGSRVRAIGRWGDNGGRDRG